MSLRYEQYRSLHDTQNLLYEMLCRDDIPVDVTGRAMSYLRHFPFLDKTGAPMFSQDEFDCPVIEEEK